MGMITSYSIISLHFTYDFDVSQIDLFDPTAQFSTFVSHLAVRQS